MSLCIFSILYPGQPDPADIVVTIQKRRAKSVISKMRRATAKVHCLDDNRMLNKNSLAVKKVRGQSEATMVISDQKL